MQHWSSTCLRGGLLASVAVAAAAVSGAAWAQTKTFDLPAQPAATGAAAFARQADVQVLISAADAQGRRTNAVRGAYSVPEAMNLLLAGTGLAAQVTGASTYTLFPARAAATSVEEVIVTAEK